MRENGRVPGDHLRAVWQFLAQLSNGRRAAPLDAGFIASRLGASASRETVATALRILQERGVLSEIRSHDIVRVRLLASALRLECERVSLSTEALQFLSMLDDSLGADVPWQSVSITSSGLSAHRFTRVLDELESRQLVFADRSPPRAVVANDSRSRTQLERLILQLKTRLEVERVKLASMVGYATALMCRRRYILNYFGDDTSQSTCGQCDVCAPAK
jgi:hypothetical protein